MTQNQTSLAVEQVLSYIESHKLIACRGKTNAALKAVAEKYKRMEQALLEISNGYVLWQHDVGDKPQLEDIAELVGEALAFDPLSLPPQP